MEVKSYDPIMTALPEWLTIGEIAARSGVPHTTLRFYEGRGLVVSYRSPGNQRRYRRSALRRLAFIRAAQRVGLSLEQVSDALATLPADQAPTRRDWTRLSRSWRKELDARIDALIRLRDNLDGCIGCGCLSLQRCALYNPGDAQAAEGPGAPKLRPTAEGGT